MLRSQLKTMLIIFQLISHLQEALLPLAFKYYGSKVSGCGLSVDLTQPCFLVRRAEEALVLFEEAPQVQVLQVPD
jgi:hypothetical protein